MIRCAARFVFVLPPPPPLPSGCVARQEEERNVSLVAPRPPPRSGVKEAYFVGGEERHLLFTAMLPFPVANFIYPMSIEAANQ